MTVHALAGFDLRPLDLAEAPALGQALAGLDPWKTLGFSGAGLSAYLGREDPGLRRLVADSGGWPAGVLALRSPWLRGPYVELLAVFADQQGRGFGRAMVEWAAAEARAAGSANLWACVSAFNAGGRAFWTAAGFIETAELPDLVAEGQAEILLRRRLG